MVERPSIPSTCCILGLGYIGLPTAAVLAGAGHRVIGVDVNADVVATVNQGQIHIVEPELDQVVAKAAKNIKPVEGAELVEPTPVAAGMSDREKLIAELHAERDAAEKAASQAAQEAEATAWLEAKRAAEESGESGEQVD